MGKKKLTKVQRLKLIRNVYDWLYERTDSFGWYEGDSELWKGFAAEIAYLLGAIAKNNKIEIGIGESADDSPLLTVLTNPEYRLGETDEERKKDAPPKRVWDFIQIVPKERS